MMRLCFLRISKEDLSLDELNNDFGGDKEKYIKYKLIQQKKAISSEFNVSKFDDIFWDSGSAFNIDKIKLRTEFLRFCKKIFKSDKLTIQDIFLRNFSIDDDFEIYTWDYNRLMRNFEYNMFFLTISDIIGNIKIFSFRQGLIEKKENETPAEKFARYVLCSVAAFDGESYSQNISDNTKKSVVRDGLISKSDKKGKLWGKGFKRSDGSRLSIKESESLFKLIISKIKYYESKHFKAYYNFIIDDINKDFGVLISKSVLTRVKKFVNKKLPLYR